MYSGEPCGHWPLFFLFKAYSCSDKDVHATVLGVKTMLFLSSADFIQNLLFEENKTF